MAKHYQLSRIKIILFVLTTSCSTMTSFAVTLNLFSCLDATPLIFLFTALYATPDITALEASSSKQKESSLELSDTSDLHSSLPSTPTEPSLEEKRQKCIAESRFVKYSIEQLEAKHLYPLKDILYPDDYDKAIKQFNAIFRDALLYSKDPETNFGIGNDQESGKKIIYHKLFITKQESGLNSSYTEEELITFRECLFEKSLASNIQIFQAAIMRPLYKAIKETYDYKHSNHKINPIYRKKAKKEFRKAFYQLKNFCDIKLDIRHKPSEHKNIIIYTKTEKIKAIFQGEKSLEEFPNVILNSLQKINCDLESINHQYIVAIRSALKNHLAPLYSDL